MLHGTFRTSLAVFMLAVLTAFVPAELGNGITPLQQLFVMKDVKPNLERVGIIVSKANNNEEMRETIQRAGAALNVQLVLAEVSALPDIAPNFRTLVREHKVQVLWIPYDDDVLNSPNGRGFLIQNALKAGIPVFAPSKAWVNEGACMTMTKGADGIELIVNKTAADALSITVPDAYAQRTQFLAAN